jgi:hypothetical protein
VAGGYKLSGRWSFSSGCDHCHSVMLGAICSTREVLGRSVPDFRSFLLLGDQYRIDDNWHVAGLKGTGSKDIIVENAFVAEYRSQSHIDYAMNASLPGQERNSGPLYRLPWSEVFNTALAASVLGASRGFVDSWTSQTRERKLSLGGRAADDALMQRRLAEAIWLIDVTIARLRTDITELWQMAHDRAPVPMQLRAQVRWNMNRDATWSRRRSAACFGRQLDARYSSITRYNCAFKTSRRRWRTRTCLRIRSQRRWADICWVRRSPNLSCKGACWRRRGRSSWRYGQVWRGAILATFEAVSHTMRRVILASEPVLHE